jgi:50S ribosomal protein L16 3-hydroxylase
MLYLPPRYAHDGVAQGECMTYSIGFRAPAQGEWAQDLMQRLADVAGDATGTRYADRDQAAMAQSGAIPEALQEFARRAVEKVFSDPLAFERSVGESLTEPKANVFFTPTAATLGGGIAVDRSTRLLYDERHVFINGEAYRAGGKDFALLKDLANVRSLSEREVKGLSAQARGLLQEWLEMGWIHATHST